MPRLALGLAYDGSVWQGWQTQPHRQTVQDTLESALRQFPAAPAATICAGRTDAGVHAAMQVIHLDSEVQRRPESWVRGLNALLPPSIAGTVGAARSGQFPRPVFRLVPYVYLSVVERSRPPRAVGRARAGASSPWTWSRPRGRRGVDRRTRLQQFPFFPMPRPAIRCVRCSSSISGTQGCFLVFTLRANAASLPHGAQHHGRPAADRAKGGQPASWMRDLLDARDRTRGAPTFMPDGLYLSAIEYAPEFALDDLDGRRHLLSPFA